MYSKLEKITKNEVPSFTTLTSVYASEIIKSHANKDGFVHNSASYHHQLYNDAQIFTLNGAYNNNRSILDIVYILLLCLLPQSEMIGFPKRM